jgi:(1->4)-alpha-D-glucan 1-alpha-D-glucosylmutase
MTPALTATYRVQMNSTFTFARAREIVPYLHRLGVSHLYCSPILTARRGSRHGYDVVDPTRLNPELGTDDDLRALAAALHERDMGLVVDIVPNHMGIGAENPFWDDVLERGERSRYARWFDIDWGTSRRSAGDGRVVLPILGGELEQVIDRGELTLRASAAGHMRLAYFEHSFPLDPTTLPPELQLVQLDPGVRSEALADFARESGGHALKELVDAQHYRLCGFEAHAGEINYRHFFDVPDLAALRVEDADVFDETHALIHRLVQEGIVDGLRVDHVDGLRDPERYLQQLRGMGGGGSAMGKASSSSIIRPVFVEKILATDEELRESWPVDGTTGYDFLNDLEDVYLDPKGAADVERTYRQMRRLAPGLFADVARNAKRTVVTGALRADLDRVAELCAELARAAGNPFDSRQLGNAIADLIASLPVYRTYVDGRGAVHDADRAVLEQALADVKARAPGSLEAAEFVVDVVLGRSEAGGMDQRLEFVQRLQQLSGPATAKGVEDTALYVYVPLVSRNEVGGAPNRDLEAATERLHRKNALRQQRWPRGLICTTTHDTKRSADIRSRLDVLSEVPADWERSIRRWRRLNSRHRVTVRGRLAPDTNTEYLLYQTLIAIWPPPRAGRRSDDLPDRTWRESARERLDQYIIKAAREAKMRTTWTTPDAPYEAALRSFVRAVLTPGEDAPFLADVARLVSRIAMAGAWNALSRLFVHLTAPGTPDIYQGDELWNFVLVDPDNRRPVDYAARQSALDSLESAKRFNSVDPFDSRTKLTLIQRILQARRTHPALFASGNYQPLVATGERASHVVAYLRSHEDQHAICMAPRLLCELEVSRDFGAWWGDTAVQLPVASVGGKRSWVSIVDGERLEVAGPLPLRSTASQFPGAVLLTD